MKFTEQIKLWLTIGRLYSIPQSVLPYFLAVVIAAKIYHVNWVLSILGFFGVVLVQFSVNMLDDYFDWKKGAVEKYKKLLDAGMQARTHKCFYLEENLTTINTVLVVALSLDAIACLIGLYIALKVGYSVVLIAAIAGALGFFYSAPPLKLSYRGLGEIAIGIIFGPLIMAGAYITAGGVVDKTIVLASIFVGALTANVAHTHAIMDFKSDMEVGKLSLATSLKTKENAVIMQAFIYFVSYFVVGVGVLLKIFPLVCLLVFITLPKVLGLVRLMGSELKEKQSWMGPIENWEQYKQEGSEWFMMRFCISRNISVEFILIFALTYYLFG